MQQESKNTDRTKWSILGWSIGIFVVAFAAVALSSPSPKQVDLNKVTAASNERPHVIRETNVSSSHDNKWFKFDQAASTAVQNVDGVSYGAVFVTDQNAYVAITVDHTADMTVRDRVDQNNTGGDSGTYNPDTGSAYWNNERVVTPYSPDFTVEDPDGLNDTFRAAIADAVKQKAPAAKNVFISANMDYVNTFSQFATEALMGKKLDALTGTFNTTVRNQFSGNAADRNKGVPDIDLP
jgi:hypothetical protein